MWTVKFIPEAEKEFSELDRGFKKQVIIGITKVSQNPLPSTEGGYGKTLGSKNNLELSGFFKIKFRSIAFALSTRLSEKNM